MPAIQTTGTAVSFQAHEHFLIFDFFITVTGNSNNAAIFHTLRLIRTPIFIVMSVKVITINTTRNYCYYITITILKTRLNRTENSLSTNGVLKLWSSFKVDTEELTFSSVDKCIFRGMFCYRAANTYVAHTWEHRPSPSPGGLTGFHMITSQGTEHSVLQLTSQTRLETFEEPEFQHTCHGYPEPGAPT